jgi:hypothetical protein
MRHAAKECSTFFFEEMFYSECRKKCFIPGKGNPGSGVLFFIRCLIRLGRALTFRAHGVVGGWPGERVSSASSGLWNWLADLRYISTFPMASWLGGIGKNLLDNQLYLW